MSGSAVLDWDRAVHKNVRSRDGQDAGKINAIDEDLLVIITEGACKRIQDTQITGRWI